MNSPVLTRKPTSNAYLASTQISKLFDIPTICQKLSLHGAELLDNEATAESLDILADDVLELQQITEEIDIDSDGAEESRSRSKPREEGQGFNGTVLGGRGVRAGSSMVMTDRSLPSSRADTPADIMMSEPGGGMEEGKPCKVCTYSNKPDVFACEICDTIFE